MRAILALAWTERARLLAAIACMAVVAGSAALYALLLGPTLEALFNPDAPPGLIGRLSGDLPTSLLSPQVLAWALPASILVVAGAKALAFWGQRHLMAGASERIVARLRVRAFSAVARADLMALRPLRAGDLASRLTRDADQVREAVADGVAALGRDLLSAVLLFALAVSLDRELSLIAFIAFPITAVALAWFGRRLRRAHADSDAIRGDLGARIGEVFHNVEAVKADSAEGREADRFAVGVDRLAALESRALSLRAAHHGVVEFAGVGGLALTLVWAIARIRAGELGPDTFVSFFAALMMLYEPVKGLSRVNAMFQAGASGLARVEQLATLHPERTGPDLAPPFSTLTLDRVALAFDASPPLFEDLSLTLHPGDVMVVLGPSGVGKSSLARMCLGMLVPTAGHLRFDDADLATLDRASLRHHIAWAGQDVLLFDATVLDNIRYGHPAATDADVLAAARLADVESFVDELPQGWDTRLGERGQRLSGGQRQRLALARALVKPARLLILDEALTGVDAEARLRILSDTIAARPELMVLLITHDATLVPLATRTLRLG